MPGDGVILLIEYRALPGRETVARDELSRLVAAVVENEPDCSGIEILRDMNDGRPRTSSQARRPSPSSMPSRSRMRAVALLSCLVIACGRARTETPGTSADSAFAALQERGATAMGVDQYTSSHVFESLPDGGRIVLQRDSVDSVGTATIRAHMQDIARLFSAGDFSVPGMVHAMEVPGTAVMAARRANIRYVAETLPRGAQVRIFTTDPTALSAVHDFLAFQRSDHRAKGHAH